jgi:alpha-beta hydrolase superfamily lysophospholipase
MAQIAGDPATICGMVKRSLTMATGLAAAVLTVSPGLSAQPRTAAAAKGVTVLGFKLHYLEAGRGAPVVLLHGLGGDGSRWAPNIESLAKDFHVFALDQIGCGHMPQLEKADEFNRLVRGFLSSAAPTRDHFR